VIIFASLVQNLNFSMKADQILLIVRFDKDSELFSKLLAILNAGEFMNMSNFRFELRSGSRASFSFIEAMQVLILLEVVEIIWEFVDQKFNRKNSLLGFIQGETCLVKQLIK